jgi:hypothetical protein
LRIVGLDLQKLRIVDDRPDDVFHVVRPFWIVGDDLLELGVAPVDGVVAGEAWWVFLVVLGQVAKEALDKEQALLV